MEPLPLKVIRAAITSMMSPGMKRTDRNTRRVTMNRVGITSSTRLITYARTSAYLL